VAPFWCLRCIFDDRHGCSAVGSRDRTESTSCAWDTFQTLRSLEMWQKDAKMMQLVIEFTPSPSWHSGRSGRWLLGIIVCVSGMFPALTRGCIFHLSQHQDIKKTCIKISWESIWINDLCSFWFHEPFFNASIQLQKKHVPLIRWSSLMIDPKVVFSHGWT
jgi:hypothetical protein